METVAEKVSSALSHTRTLALTAPLTGTHCSSQAGYCCVLIARLFPSSAFARAEPSVVSDALRCPFITVQKVRGMLAMPPS
jgi:hypothetical protein